jgi:membrane fusion protein (multidrug efflux system)
MEQDLRLAMRVPVRVMEYLVVALYLLGSLGCHQPAPSGEPELPSVGVVESRRMDVPVEFTPNATTRALESVTIRARVRGFLTERHFVEGAFVKKGQLLLVIDEEPYKVALRSALASQAEAASELRKAQQSKAREVAAAQVALDHAQLILAQVQERRSRTLLARNAGTVEDLDKTEADRKKWEAQVVADRAKDQQSQSDYEVGIASATAQLEAGRAAVRDAELSLGYCRMYAPLDGKIGEAKVKVGNLVGPESAGGGAFSELATIQQLDPMGVDVRLSSRDLERIGGLLSKGLAVRLTRPGASGAQEHPYTGEGYFIDNTIDETTSTFLAKARMPNPDGSLLPGEYVKLRLVVDRLAGAIVVPAPAVIETDSGPVVHIVNREGKVAVQRVDAAGTHEGLRIITSGLEAGVPVIVDGLQMVQPGAVVKTTPVIAIERANAATTFSAAGLAGAKNGGSRADLAVLPGS